MRLLLTIAGCLPESCAYEVVHSIGFGQYFILMCTESIVHRNDDKNPGYPARDLGNNSAIPGNRMRKGRELTTERISKISAVRTPALLI